MSTSKLRVEDKISFLDFWVEDNILHIKKSKNKILKRDKSISLKLKAATMRELMNYEILGDGEGVYWPLIDEDLSAAYLICPEKFQCKKSKGKSRIKK
ncbi:MAG: DUF2442 domain-containing protein [Oligoflexia bacterium]|nr:DUF2442 domain-containing protein [Oligoflexia bacterium]